MDKFHLWKEDYRREVEDVLSARRLARERGEDPGSGFGEGFTGRLSDLVIPPAGIYAQARTLQERLSEAEALAEALRRRAEESEAERDRERGRRERLKDAAMSLALGEARRARDAAEASAGFLKDARLETSRAEALAEEAGRASMARLQAARGLQARLDSALLADDEKEAEISSLRARLEAALRRTEETSAVRGELAAERAASASRQAVISELERRVQASSAAARESSEEAAEALARAAHEAVRRGIMEAALEAESRRTVSEAGARRRRPRSRA